MDAAAVVLQSWWDKLRHEKRFSKMCSAFTTLQASIRAKLYRDAWTQHCMAVTTIQRNAKAFIRRRDDLFRNEAVLIMQGATRAYLMRASLRHARREF